MLRIICQLFGLNEALRWYHFWHIKHEPLQVTQYWWSIGGRKIVRYKHLSVPVLWCWFLRRSEQLASVLITFLGFVTKYLMRSNLREERFALAYSLRVMVHQGREAVVLREWGGWSHWPCNQEAEGRLAVASLPNTKTPPLHQLHSFPKEAPPPHGSTTFPNTVTGWRPFVQTRESGDISIVTTFQPSYLSVHLRNWCWQCREELFEGECFRERDRALSHPTHHRDPLNFTLFNVFNVYVYPMSPTENSFICWLFYIPVFK